MAITAQELNVILSARDKQFTKAMDRASNRVARFASKSQKQLQRTGRGFDTLGKNARRLTAVLAGVFSVRAIGGLVDAAAQIKILADVAGVSATEFQKMAQASRTVGIGQEKLSDIMKDVNDKFGDFLVTGAGPLADFFETVAPLVGVTADSFRNLSGPDALQLYVDSLDQANLSQAQMTFFMEAIASDATALLPLLRNNGREMKKLGQEAAIAGRILSDDAVDGAKELKDKFDDLRSSMGTAIQKGLLENADEIMEVVGFFTDDVLPEVLKLVQKFQRLRGGGKGAQPSSEQEAIDQADAKAFSDADNFKNNKPKSSGQLLLDGDPELQADINKTLAENAKKLANKPSDQVPPVFKTAEELEAERKARDQLIKDLAAAKAGYQDLLASLDPVSAAQLEYNRALETMAEFERLSGEEIANKDVILGQLNATLQRTKDEMSGMADIADTLEQSLTDAFMAAVDGSRSFEDSMRQTAAAVIKELYRVLVVQQLVNAAMGAFGFSPVPGGGFTRTGAGGRQMQAGVPYMTGESGRELFVPSTPGRLLSPSQTNNAMGASGGVVVNQTINLSTGVSQTVRAEVQGMLPRITEATKAAVADAARRGGPYAKAFT